MLIWARKNTPTEPWGLEPVKTSKANKIHREFILAILTFDFYLNIVKLIMWWEIPLHEYEYTTSSTQWYTNYCQFKHYQTYHAVVNIPTPNGFPKTMWFWWVSQCPSSNIVKCNLVYLWMECNDNQFY